MIAQALRSLAHHFGIGMRIDAGNPIALVRKGTAGRASGSGAFPCVICQKRLTASAGYDVRLRALSGHDTRTSVIRAAAPRPT